MPEYQQRVVDELAARKGEVERLEAFFGTPTFAGLDPADQNLLQEQAPIMRALVGVLARRIARF